VKYLVDVEGEEVLVELVADEVRVDGESVAAHVAEVVGTPVYLVTVRGVMYRVAVQHGHARGEYTLWTDGYRVEVEATDERTQAIRRLSGRRATRSGPSPLIAPMPGLIVRVHVRPGDAVQAGQGLVAMEAMKMENELRATSAGTVKSVRVEPGTVVEKGAVLVELE